MKAINIIELSKEVISFTHYWGQKPAECVNIIILTPNCITPLTSFKFIFTLAM